MPRDIEEHIRHAIEEGHFDNLPGKGKPLKLSPENPHEDPEWRMAHHVLHSGGFTLPWIEAWKEIEAELEAARAAFTRTSEWRKKTLASEGWTPMIESETQRAREVFQQKLGELNKRISDYNLQTPSNQLQRPLLDIEQELKRIDA